MARHILVVDLDKFNLDEDNNFDVDDSDTVIHVKFLAWHSKFENARNLKKNKQRINACSVAS